MPIFSQFGEIVWQRLFNIVRILQTTALKCYVFNFTFVLNLVFLGLFLPAKCSTYYFILTVKNKSETDNPRAFWKAYRPFMHSRSSKPANDITLIDNDVVITDRKELAELFNNYFVHIVDDVYRRTLKRFIK